MKRLILVAALLLAHGAAAGGTMRMAVTTSFNNSGLADILLPEIEADLDLTVQLWSSAPDRR